MTAVADNLHYNFVAEVDYAFLVVVGSQDTAVAVAVGKKQDIEKEHNFENKAVVVLDVPVSKHHNCIEESRKGLVGFLVVC